MKKILALTHSIYKQAVEMAEQILKSVQSLSAVNPEITLSNEEIATLTKIGKEICTHNQCNVNEIDSVFMFDGLDGVYNNYYTTELHLALELLVAIWDNQGLDYAWGINGDNGDVSISWRCTPLELEIFKQLDDLLA